MTDINETNEWTHRKKAPDRGEEAVNERTSEGIEYTRSLHLQLRGRVMLHAKLDVRYEALRTRRCQSIQMDQWQDSSLILHIKNTKD